MERAMSVFIFVYLALFSHQIYAREGDCIYALGKGINAYCSFISAPDDTKRYLEVIYPPQMAITSCVDNTVLPFSFSSEMIGNNNLVAIGSHTITFYQCNTIDCIDKKSVGENTFVVNKDKTVTPNKFNITLDVTFGANCSPAKLNPNDIAMIIPKVDCKNAYFCATLNLPGKIHKFIKVVSDNDAAFTYCVSNLQAIALPNGASAGTHAYTFYQCDSLNCKNPKLISKEMLTVAPNGKLDREHAILDLDPAFGASCKP